MNNQREGLLEREDTILTELIHPLHWQQLVLISILKHMSGPTGEKRRKKIIR